MLRICVILVTGPRVILDSKGPLRRTFKGLGLGFRVLVGDSQ